MPTTFRQSIANGVGTTPVDVLTIPNGVRSTVIGLNIANTTDYDTVRADVFVIDETSTSSFYVRGLTIPPNTSAKVVTQGEKLIMPQNTTLRLVADTDGSLDVIVSHVEIS
jgi:hypothetical protein